MTVACQDGCQDRTGTGSEVAVGITKAGNTQSSAEAGVAVTVEGIPSNTPPIHEPLRIMQRPKSPDDLILLVEINAKVEVVVKVRNPLVKNEEIRDHPVEEYQRLRRVADEKKVALDPDL
ncbi:MAG TPA: hypothetical protein VKD71_12230 [Gemmataceae bacterium]|nr:hypothetical protein [Gemmataceae bacterium]